MAALQKALDDSVPSSDLEKANRQYTELTVKYRDLLQRDGHLVQRTTSLEQVQVSRPISWIQSPHTLIVQGFGLIQPFSFLSSRLKTNLSGSKYLP